MLEEPVTFERAQAFLAAREAVPTTLGSRALALSPSFPAAVRAQAFYSAKVSSANILDKLKGEIERYLSGEQVVADGVRGSDLASMRLRLKRFLINEGYEPDDVTDGPLPEDPEEAARVRELRSVQNLASTRRLNLILETNAKQAQAAGRYQVDTDPDIAERWPYWQYDALSDARDRHAALDGLVLRKDDPFWDSHTPPWEYGCRCAVYNADSADAARAGGVTQTTTTTQPNGSQDSEVRPPNGLPFRVPPNASGYAFRVDAAAGVGEADFSFDAVKNDLLRPIVAEQVRAVQRQQQGGA